MQTTLIAAMLLASSAPATEAPVTLKCFIEKAPNDMEFLFSLNEAEGQVTVESANGVMTRPAIFSSEKVKIDIFGGDFRTFYIEISRADLTLKMLMLAKDGPVVTGRGNCNLPASSMNVISKS